MIHSIGVVIPARDEELLLPDCLESVARATAELATAAPELTVAVLVVADDCRDATVARARVAGVEVLETADQNVGVARARGVEFLLAAGVDWIANTDADSRVPADWLVEQVHQADTGADAVVGRVQPDLRELSAEKARAWHATHDGTLSLGNVHGANLGFSASAYRSVGGYRALAEHEDVDLVARLRESAARVTDGTTIVVTSSRLVGRTPGGFARFLREDLMA